MFSYISSVWCSGNVSLFTRTTYTTACGISETGSYVNSLVLRLLDQTLIIPAAMGPLCPAEKGLCPGRESRLNALKYVVAGPFWHVSFIRLWESTRNHSGGIFFLYFLFASSSNSFISNLLIL